MKATENIRDITMAVLPMRSMSDNPNIAMFCSGLVMDLITDLSRFRPFQIIAYDTVQDLHADHAAEQSRLEELDLDYVVKGHARYQNDRLILNVQLVNIRQNRLVWAEKFTGPLEELFHFQEEIVEKIVGSLQQYVDHDLLSGIRQKPVTSFNVYECWLRGYRELKKGSLEADKLAREYFMKAIDLDPHYARAYSGMSLTYFNEWSCQIWDRWEVSQKGAFEWAEKAVDLDEHDHISTAILGRLYIFNGEYEKAEHFLRKALRLNPNDAENLLHVALGLVYLGYVKEAQQIYEKARRLNPVSDATNYSIGTMVYLEIGDFEKAISLSRKHEGRRGWVDFPAFQAAAYYRHGDIEEAHQCWNIFLQEFSQKIYNGQPVDSAMALKWMMDVNPYKGATQMRPFWEYIGQGAIDTEPQQHHAHRSANRMTLDGEFWTLIYKGALVQLADLKGLHDIMALLQAYPEGVHCLELMEAAIIAPGTEVIDAKAKAEYRQRILAIQAELEDAEEFQNNQRVAQLQEEYDALLDHLSKSLGLGDQARKAGSSVEKARSAVTWRIRSAISKIADVHPALGKHFKRSIKTGTICQYAPEQAIEWELGG